MSLPISIPWKLVHTSFQHLPLVIHRGRVKPEGIRSQMLDIKKKSDHHPSTANLRRSKGQPSCTYGLSMSTPCPPKAHGYFTNASKQWQDHWVPIPLHSQKVGCEWKLGPSNAQNRPWWLYGILDKELFIQRAFGWDLHVLDFHTGGWGVAITMVNNRCHNGFTDVVPSVSNTLPPNPLVGLANWCFETLVTHHILFHAFPDPSKYH